MPCHTRRATPITFENVAYKAGHQEVLIAALMTMGYQVDARTIYKHGTDKKLGEGLVIFPAADRFATVETKIIYRDGRFQIPSTMKERFTLEKVQNAYGMQAARVMARKNGWQFKQVNETEFQIVRR